jgi:hypothetical protein
VVNVITLLNIRVLFGTKWKSSVVHSGLALPGPARTGMGLVTLLSYFFFSEYIKIVHMSTHRRAF